MERRRRLHKFSLTPLTFVCSDMTQSHSWWSKPCMVSRTNTHCAFVCQLTENTAHFSPFYVLLICWGKNQEQRENWSGNSSRSDQRRWKAITIQNPIYIYLSCCCCCWLYICINCLCWSRLNLWRHNIVSVFSNVFLFDISVTTSHVPITNSKMTRHNLRINIDWTLIIFHFFLTPTLKLGRGTNEITNITSSFDMVKICVSKLFIPRGWIT